MFTTVSGECKHSYVMLHCHCYFYVSAFVIMTLMWLELRRRIVFGHNMVLEAPVPQKWVVSCLTYWKKLLMEVYNLWGLTSSIASSGIHYFLSAITAILLITSTPALLLFWWCGWEVLCWLHWFSAKEYGKYVIHTYLRASNISTGFNLLSSLLTKGVIIWRLLVSLTAHFLHFNIGKKRRFPETLVHLKPSKWEGWNLTSSTDMWTHKVLIQILRILDYDFI